MIAEIHLKKPEKDLISKAAAILESGGLVVYPTDTAYGLGVNALNAEAVKKMYEIKDRDRAKPTHVVVKDWNMIQKLTYTSETAKRLYEGLLPGPLTIILLKRNIVPNVLTAGLPSLGVRIPDNPVTNELSRRLTFPYTTPSANRSGEKPPYSLNELKQVLDLDYIDLVLNAGELPSTPPSTIIDLSRDDVDILREGPIKSSEVEGYLIKN